MFRWLLLLLIFPACFAAAAPVPVPVPGPPSPRTGPTSPKPAGVPTDAEIAAFHNLIRENKLKEATAAVEADGRLANAGQAVSGRYAKQCLYQVDYSQPPAMVEMLLAHGALPNQATALATLLTWIAQTYGNGHWPFYVGPTDFSSFYTYPGQFTNAFDTLNPILEPPLNLQAVECLLEAGADSNQRNLFPGPGPISGNSGLEMAAARRTALLFHLFLRYHPDLQQTNTAGMTLVHFCAAGGCIKTMAILLEHGLDINARDEGGHTPLFYAVVLNDFAMVQYLLDHGAEADAVDAEGHTVLHFVLDGPFHDRPAVFQLLLDHGARYTRDRQGHTALAAYLDLRHELRALLNNSQPCAQQTFLYRYEQWLPGWLLLALTLLVAGGWARLQRRRARLQLQTQAQAPAETSAPTARLSSFSWPRDPATLTDWDREKLAGHVAQLFQRRTALVFGLIPASVLALLMLFDPALRLLPWWLQSVPLVLLWLYGSGVALLYAKRPRWWSDGAQTCMLAALGLLLLSSATTVLFWKLAVDAGMTATFAVLTGFFGLAVIYALGGRIATWRIRRIVKRAKPYARALDQTGIDEPAATGAAGWDQAQQLPPPARPPDSPR